MPTSARFPIDPGLLERYGVIKAKSEPWNYVRDALQRLAKMREDMQPTAEMEKDRDAILSYSELLNRSGDSVFRAILLAAHFAKLSDRTTPVDRLMAGLGTLSEGLDLVSLDETGVNGELARIFAELPGASMTVPPLPPKPTQDQMADWSASLKKALETVHDLRRPDPTEFEQAAWSTWQRRLQDFENVQPDVPADPAYLLCRARRSPAGTVLPARLKKATLGQWGEAFNSAVAKDSAIPLWFSIGLLRALGFGTHGLERANTNPPMGPEEGQAVMAAIQGDASRNPQKGLIVLRTTANSVTSSWGLDNSVPTLALPADHFHSEKRIDLSSYFRAWLHGILIEVGEGEKAEDALKRVRPDLTTGVVPNVRTAFLIRSRASLSSAIPADMPYTDAIKSARDASSVFTSPRAAV